MKVAIGLVVVVGAGRRARAASGVRTRSRPSLVERPTWHTPHSGGNGILFNTLQTSNTSFVL